MDDKETRKAVQFEHYKRMFGSCDKEPLVEVFAALLVKLNDSGVMFEFPNIQTEDSYVSIYDDDTGLLKQRLKIPKPSMVLWEEIKLNFLQHDVEVLQKLKGKV
ncbi:hypothetical protein [Lacrimispora sp.]|uniref:hypothetical protein n=1 Tax=Lacrimispora sp. TaxID=2719234 RepID=UPI003993D8E1